MLSQKSSSLPHMLSLHKETVNLIQDIDKQVQELEMKISQIESVQDSIKPSLKYPKNIGYSKNSLQYNELRSYVGKFDRSAADHERLVIIWEKLRNYGETRFFSEADYIDGLGCLLDNRLHEHFMTIKSGSLREVLTQLANRFVFDRSLFDHEDQINSFTRKDGESIRTAIARLNAIIIECLPSYPEEQRETRRSILIERATRDLVSPRARQEIDRLSSDYRLRGSIVPVSELIRTACHAERLYGAPEGNISASLSLNNVETSQNNTKKVSFRPDTPRHPSRDRSASYSYNSRNSSRDSSRARSSSRDKESSKSRGKDSNRSRRDKNQGLVDQLPRLRETTRNQLIKRSIVNLHLVRMIEENPLEEFEWERKMENHVTFVDQKLIMVPNNAMA